MIRWLFSRFARPRTVEARGLSIPVNPWALGARRVVVVLRREVPRDGTASGTSHR